MRVYLASRFQRREELLEYRKQIVSNGHEVDCRWLTDPLHRVDVDVLSENSRRFNAELAFHDLDDLARADAILFFSPGGTRGGCHVEFGYAMATLKRLIWVGPFQHVFSYLPAVEQFNTFEECMDKVFGKHMGHK